MTNTLRLRRAEHGERGISQRDLARLASIHPDRYWRIENQYAEPTEDEQAALAKVLGVARNLIFPEPQVHADVA
jgi:transcriptional regulator with XRE-family HTH domain